MPEIFSNFYNVFFRFRCEPDFNCRAREAPEALERLLRWRSE